MKLYLENYKQVHKWKKMAFAVREWVLRSNHSLIVPDLKFLVKHGIEVIVYHNIGVNKWSQKFLSEYLRSKLPESVQFERIPGDQDLYAEVLKNKEHVDKLILLERQFLIWEEGDRINTISTAHLGSVLKDNNMHGLAIGNINFRRNLLRICQAIESRKIHRIHILPGWKKNAIKHELFSLEWSWTLVWNDFWSPDIVLAKRWEESIILWILDSNKNNKFLKPRTKEYVHQHIANFCIAKIDDIPVWCVEIIEIDHGAIELWGLAVINSFLSFKIGLTLVEYVENVAKKNMKSVISLTNNPKLESLYEWRGFRKNNEQRYPDRQDRSPNVDMFILDL